MSTYRADMGAPPMPNEGAPGPMTEKQRMGKTVIGSKADLPKGYVHKREPDEGAKPKKYAKGGVTRADGCAQRGKTKGRML